MRNKLERPLIVDKYAREMLCKRVVLLTNQKQVMLEALKKASVELNTIRARDGVPWTHHGWKSDVQEEYFSSVVDECFAAIQQAEAKDTVTAPRKPLGSSDKLNLHEKVCRDYGVKP